MISLAHTVKLSEMDLFAVRFLALDRIPKLLPGDFVVDENNQKLLLDKTLGRISNNFPLPKVHVQSLLESIVRTCESLRIDVHEEVYERLAFVSQQATTEVTFGHYVIGSRDFVFRVHGDPFALVQDGSTGFMTWEAGKCLCWYLACERDLGGKRILEIGCGTGITGIITRWFQSNAEYCFTDYHTSTLENAKKNCELNSLLKCASFKQLDMLQEDPEELFANVIVGSDILYDEALAAGLVRFLEHPNIKFEEAVIVSTIRTEKTYNLFIESLERSGKLRYESIYRLPFSSWVDIPRETDWKYFLNSNQKLFDPVIDLVRIVPV